MKKSLIGYLEAIKLYIKIQPSILLYVLISVVISLLPYIDTVVLNLIFDSIQNKWLLMLCCAMVGYIVLQLVNNILNLVSSHILYGTNVNINCYLKERVFELGGQVSSVNFENEKWVQEYKRCEKLTGSVHDLFMSTVSLLANVITLITYIIYLFNLISFYAILGFLILIPTLVQSFVFSRQSYFNEKKIEKEKQRADDIKSMFLTPHILKEIKLYGSGKYIISKWKEKIDLIFSKKQRHEIKFTLYTSSLHILNSITIFGILSCVYINIKRGGGSVGTIISLIPFILTLISSFGRTSNNVDGVVYSVQEYQELCELFELKKSNNITSRKKITDLSSIVIENVNFKYPESNQLVLRNINFSVNFGDTIALVGKNGSGKSTLLKIIAGIYSPQDGSVYYNGQNINIYNCNDINQQISFVFQEPIHYPFNFRRNILFGDDEEKTIDGLLESVSYEGNIEDDDSILTPGYKNSKNLSGGQWQKIGIARAIKNNNASFYIFDEPTASLDPQSELDIFDTFLTGVKGKSVIVSTHRLGLAKHANKIIVLDQGEIVGIGSHEELLNNCPIYFDLYEAQKKWYDNVVEAPE